MVVYAEFEIPAEGFSIGRAFGELPDVRIELDRIVPSVDAVVPFIWVQGPGPDEVMPATLDHEAVETIEHLGTEEGAWSLYRVVWNRSVRDTIVEISDAEIAVLSGEATADTWWFEFRATSREPIAALHDHLEAIDVPSTLVRLTEATPGPRDSPLTRSQFEALRLAFDRGYFDEPRGTTLEAMAAELDISRQAFAGRLRRALHTLVSNTVLTSEADAGSADVA
jgi:predicted DNA binding protein